ncbi:hypothetical protein QQ045_009872 [Rhodiola kirilowii]
MKLLDWMHQKIRKGQPYKDLSIGSCYTCISTHDDPKYATYTTSRRSNWRETSNEVEARIAQQEIQEESFAESPNFQGFFSIGFLGSEQFISEPVTPTFKTLTEGQISAIDNEIIFINEELEKFFENEATEDNTGSSGRNSRASDISFANMQGDGVEEQEHMSVCPLQDYLFGSTIELPHSKEDAKKKNTSLRELFQRIEQSEKYSENNKKEHSKFAFLSAKKLLKRLQAPNLLIPSAEKVTSTRKKNKFHKVLKMFRRKVQPETSNGTNFISHCELDAGNFRKTANPSDMIERHAKNSPPSQNDNFLTENKEQWITTDTDYFVLEL